MATDTDRGGRVIRPELPRSPLSATPTGYVDGGEVLPEAEFAPRPLPPPTPSGWYRVFVPTPGWAGNRYDVHFERGEAIVHETQMVTRPLSGSRGLRIPTINLLVQELGYRAEPLPVGVPPVPTWQLAQLHQDLPVPAGEEVN